MEIGKDNLDNSNKLKINKLKRQTLNQMVYESLKMSILEGDLPAESKLNEVQVAEQLNVSPTPVREAFRMLSSEGLVEIIPWKGVFVKSFSDAEVLEVYQCREALEVLAVELAIDKIEEKDLKELDNYIALSKEIDDVSKLVDINTNVHKFIINKSGNTKLKFLIEILDDVLLHDRNVSAFDSIRRKEIVQEHLNLLNALKVKDLDKAKEAMRIHIRNGYNYIEEKIHQEKS